MSKSRRLWSFSPESLVSQFGSPLYVYEEKLIRRQANRFMSIPYHPFKCYFASMSNNNPEILKKLHSLGAHLFVNTPKHLLLGLSCGFAPNQIVFTSTNQSVHDMQYAIKAKVTLNLDSLGQLEQYGRLNPDSKVGLRINILTTDRYHEGTGVYFGPKSRIGIAEEEVDEAFEIAKRYNLTLNGVHVYLGTNIHDIDLFLSGTDEILRVARRFSDLEYLDLGGGFGVPYREGEESMDMVILGAQLATRMEKLSKDLGRSVELAIEPGRAMLSETGFFLTSVTDVKERADRLYAGVDSSVDIFPRPLYYDVYTEAYHEVYISGKEGPHTEKPVDVCGSTTYSRDYLARERHLPRPEVDDILVFVDAGAYAYSLSTDFLGRCRPAEVLVHTDGRVSLIREAEKLPAIVYG
jgi:diaminopimelate decarboxylase